MKKTISALLVCALLFVLAVPAFAGSLNTWETKLIDYAKSAYEITDGVVTVPEKILGQAKTFMLRDDVDITEAQYKEIIAILDKALAYIKDAKLVDWDKDLADNETAQKALLGYASDALAVVGLTCTADRANGVVRIYKDGVEIANFKPASIIVQTGADNTAIGVAFATVMLVACAGAFGVKRFRKEDDEA